MSVFDELLKDASSLPNESAIAVHFKSGRGGILFGLDAQSQNLSPEHHILPHSGALAGYDVAAVVEEARRRASILADALRSMPRTIPLDAPVGSSGRFHCKRCGKRMALVTTIAASGDQPSFRIFRCAACEFYDSAMA